MHLWQVQLQTRTAGHLKRNYNWYDKCADDIDENYTYEGSDLGIEATEDYTTFKIWAPSATYIKVNIYRKGVNDDDESSKVGSFTLEKNVR